MADEGPAGVLIGVGASAGGVEALLALVAGLDEDLPAALFVVLHQAATAPTVLPGLLARRCRLPVEGACDGTRSGRAAWSWPGRTTTCWSGTGTSSWTADPGRTGTARASTPCSARSPSRRGPGPSECVLSGMLHDGAAGMLEIVRRGGNAVVQEPAEAGHDSMPRAALARVPGAIVTPAHAVGAALRELVAAAPSAGAAPRRWPA